MAIVLDGNRMLMIRRAATVRRGGYWSPPGGLIESSESQADAVVRELREELGIEATAIRKVWECLTDDRRFCLHWWLADTAEKALKPTPEEVAETRWITAEQFAALSPRFEAHTPFFRDVLPGLITGAIPTGSSAPRPPPQ
jgi:8-oxo-dGTP diphosphatase